MTEPVVLAAVLNSREAYDKIKHHIAPEELSPQGKMWWPMIQEWYQADRQAKHVDRDALKGRGERRLPEKHQETLLGYLESLPKEVSAVNVVQDLLDMKRHTVGNQLCAAIQSGDPKKIEPLLEKYSELKDAKSLSRSEMRWTMDDAEMLQRLDRKNLIKIAPKQLNDKCKGGAARGDHIVIFGRPEAGKTMFTVNMVSGFLRQNLKVLYIGNEEDTYKHRKRIACNLTASTPDQFEADSQVVLARAHERGLDKLWIGHLTPGTLPEIDELMKEVKPDVLVLDQIRNIDAKGDSMTVKLERLGIGVRNLLGKHDCLGVSITQARDAEGAGTWLTMEEIDSTRTGLPGQADLIIGIGSNQQLVASNQRAISLCKNKLNEDPDGRVGFLVQVDPARSKVV